MQPAHREPSLEPEPEPEPVQQSEPLQEPEYEENQQQQADTGPVEGDGLTAIALYDYQASKWCRQADTPQK